MIQGYLAVSEARQFSIVGEKKYQEYQVILHENVRPSVCQLNLQEKLGITPG